ncbi:hypothetical protein [Polaribacter cellanae]|uniref:Uncharacterized protein n=1 Tax=Polaribacter cellanae TaxID=2818493 RepID=A0A975CSQ4_9FLAO|nr:hypothetical protein [Polaribacter cellanae]QTE24140.1 hypothetical protein J3359_07705 [Polaribacter cellanae]
MYNLTITNNYKYECGFKGSTGNRIFNIKPKTSQTIDNLGDGILSIYGQGTISLLDLGDKKIIGYPIPKETWGVLIRVQTTEAYYRYEGGGDLTLTINQYGSLEISTNNGNLIEIKLPELTIK